MLLAALIANFVFWVFFAMECKFQCTKNLGTPKRELRSQLSEFTSLTVLKAENMTELTYFFPVKIWMASASHARCMFKKVCSSPYSSAFCS